MSDNIISMMWRSLKTFHRRRVKILRSLGQNEQYISLPVIRFDVAMVMALIQN